MNTTPCATCSAPSTTTVTETAIVELGRGTRRVVRAGTCLCGRCRRFTNAIRFYIL